MLHIIVHRMRIQPLNTAKCYKNAGKFFSNIEVDFKIYFKIEAFKQQNNKELKGCILLISLEDILEDIAPGKIVYALYLKEY